MRCDELMRAMLVGLLFLATPMSSGCSTSHPNPAVAVADQPGCVSECEPGYECSTTTIQGVRTGICIAKPTLCASDADCLNSAVMPGTVPLHYFCDKHSGSHPDKTGGGIISDRGTCLPTVQTGMDP